MQTTHTQPTRRRLEAAAIDLAREEGVDTLTIDRVCAEAELPRGAFHDHFWSLEHAVFGEPLSYDRAGAEAVLAEHADDLVLAVALLALTEARGELDDEIARRRFVLLAGEPSCAVESWAGGESRAALEAVLAAWLQAHPEGSRLASVGVSAEAEARLTVALAIALGKEALPHLRDAEHGAPIDPGALLAARRRLATALAPAPTRVR